MKPIRYTKDGKIRPTELCHAIAKAMYHLPDDEQASIKRVYEKTWLVVCFYHEGIATPTASCWNRLNDLHQAIRREGQRRRISYFGPYDSVS